MKNREKPKNVIVRYVRSDCVGLYDSEVRTLNTRKRLQIRL